jgi:hypothetical protein
MRYGFVILFLGLTGGCASPNVAQEAADRCEQVGISANDPDFTACTQAYRLQSQQNAISNAYGQTVDVPAPPRRGLPH